MKKRLRFINDGVLGYLLQVYFKFVDPNKDYYTFTLHITQTGELTSLSDISNIYEVIITTSKVTKEKQQELAKTKERIATMDIHPTLQDHVKNLVKEANSMDNLLKNHIEYETPISPETINIINKEFPDIYNTLVYLVKIPVTNLGKLKRFINKYAEEYSEKELELQEMLPLPKNYAELISLIINEPKYISMYGTKRLNLNNMIEKEVNQYFFHSLMYLHFAKKISINNIVMYHTGYGMAEINNLKINEQIVVESAKKPYWQDAFKWQNNTFVFGTIGSIDFEDLKAKRLFEALVAHKGDWLKRSEYIKEFTYEYIRPTVKAINTRLIDKTKKKVKIVSTRSDKTGYPKPTAGESAYRILVK